MLQGAGLRGSRIRHIRLALFGVFHGAEGYSHSLHSPAAPAEQRVLHVVPEVLRHKVVDEWVQAAVEARQAQGGNVEAVTIFCHPVFQKGIMQHQHDVAGDETDQERHQDDHNQHNYFVSVL